MRIDPRENPALLKLDLFCKGIQVEDPTVLSSRRGRGVRRTRAGLGSGLELILPGPMWTNVPVAEAFAQDSPYTLHALAGRAFSLHREGKALCRVDLAERPAWYDRETTSGLRMARVGTLQGTYLGIHVGPVCDHWSQRSGRRNCKFCSVGLNQGVDDAQVKAVSDVLEVVAAARAESGITYVDFNTGHLEGDAYLDLLAPIVRHVKERFGLLVGVQTPPHRDLRRYDELRSMGVNRVSFCLELFDRQRFREVCPGKHEEYGHDRYLEAIRYCAGLGRIGPKREPWVTNGELIAGLEPPASTIRGIEWITAVGAIPTVCVFRPLVGTDLADHPPPRTEEVVPVFRALYEECMAHRLPIGCAPNVHVSLVLLPDEARSLSQRHFRGGALRLAALRRLAAWRVSHAMASAAG